MAGKTLTLDEKVELALSAIGTLTQTVQALAAAQAAQPKTSRTRATAQPKAERAPEFSDAELAPYVTAIKALADAAYETRDASSLKQLSKLGKDREESVVQAWERGKIYGIVEKANRFHLTDKQVNFVAVRVARAAKAGYEVPVKITTRGRGRAAKA